MSIFENMSDVCHTSTQCSVCIESTAPWSTELSAQSTREHSISVYGAQCSVCIESTPLPSTELMTLKGDGTYLKVTKISRDKDNEEQRAWVVSRLSFGGQVCWELMLPATNPTGWEQLSENDFCHMREIHSLFLRCKWEHTESYRLHPPVNRSHFPLSSPFFFPSIFDLCCEGRGFLCPWFSFECDREMQAQTAGMRNKPSVF